MLGLGLGLGLGLKFSKFLFLRIYKCSKTDEKLTKVRKTD